MNYQDAQYYPIVEFSNRNSTNIITNPNNFVINAGFGYEYYTNIDSNQSFIPGWTINSDTLINVLIDENKKDSISIPIFIVQNYTNITDQSEKNLGDINLDNYKIGNLYKKITNNLYSYNIDARCTGIKITERYETDNKSSVFLTESVFENNSFVGFGRGFELFNIHKRDVNKEIYPIPAKDANSQTVSDKTKYYLTAYISYERDWYASKKEVVLTTPYGNINGDLRMKYNNEWYTKFVSFPNTYLRYNGKGFTDLHNYGAK